jgi:hypothetical protein
MRRLVARMLRRFGSAGEDAALQSRQLLRIDGIGSQLDLVIATLRQLHEKTDAAHVGLDALQAAKEQSQSQLDLVIATLRQLHEKTDAAHVRLDALQAAKEQSQSQLDLVIATLRQLHEKMDAAHVRLDALQAKVDMLSESRSHEALTATVEAQLLRLDGYLVHHASELQAGMQDIRGQIEAAAREAGERLMAEIDVLDTGILHHMAELKAKLAKANGPD